MESSKVRAIGLAILIAARAWSACSQQIPDAATVPPHVELKTGSSSSAAMPAAGDVQREIDDPHLGNRWFLVRDPSRPGGPGLMVPATAGQKAAPVRTKSAALPVIRTGDLLIVEENTPLVEARLEAVALSPAQPGSAFNVRLVAGGKVVRAVALGQGRAVFAPEKAIRP